jgi:23S rRNA pseudouridine955/2504/2580 synthase
MKPDRDFRQVRQVEVGEHQHGQRIDNFLLAQLAGVPRSVVYRILRTGQVRVNKGRIKPSYRLATGDIVRVPPVSEKVRSSDRVPTALVEQMRAVVVAEDSRYIVIDKPAGVAVHGGSGIDFGVVDAMQALYDDKNISLGHRLDRNTSGLLVLARNRPAALAFQALLKAGSVIKRYQAILCGTLNGDLSVDAPLKKFDTQEPVQVRVDADGKSARSHFTSVLTQAHFTLASILIETGRTHQIRVHAAHSGLPVLGDRRYGNWQCNRAAAARGQKRMFLHACELQFADPESGEHRSYRASQESAFKAALDIIAAD